MCISELVLDLCQKRQFTVCGFTMADDGLAVAPVQVCSLDDVVLGVHPVHASAGVVNGEAVGPEQVRVCDDAAVGAVHVGVLDARRVAPVRPVDLTEEESGAVIVSLHHLHPLKLRGKQTVGLSGFKKHQMSDATKSLLCPRIHFLFILIHLFCPGSEERATFFLIFFNYPMQMSYLIS